MSAPRAAVVGAGMAGLACAARLAEAGWQVDLFEKSRGAGGRLATRRDHGTGFDLGAQYFTARDPAFAAQVREWEAAGAVARWQVVPWLIDTHGKVLPSPDDTPRWVGTPGMSSAVRPLCGRRVALCTQSRVTAASRRGAQWRLRTEAGELPGAFDALVVAVPAPQAVPLLQQVPVLARAAAHAALGPCWAVALGYEGRTRIDIDAAFARNQPVSWLARDSAKPGRGGTTETWVLHAAPAWSEEHLEAPAEAVARHLRQWFEAVLVPGREALWAHAHRWRHARTEDALPGGCLLDAENAAGICGDWCAGGRVEGAWLSGQALAGQLIAQGVRT